ncbi:flagellar FliJ family protein [Agromyces mediolanus]|uniref:flagellar FliJ family protein n=1 Tax=Agromyces mediolanus TaxID=41986 RepID=UPI003833DE75
MKGFRLDGLLRVRRVQEERTASVLASRTAKLRDSEALRARAQRELSAYGEPGTQLETLRAIAAARASSEAMLAELLAASTLLEAEVDEAKLTHDEARRRVRTLERMEAAHAEAELETELRVEQNRLDEIASGRAVRGGEE